MIELGTRTNSRTFSNRTSTRGITRKQTEDLGMRKRYVGTGGSTTFTAGQIQDAGLPGNFAAGDAIVVYGDQRVASYYKVTATGAGALTVDPPPPAIGASAVAIEIRTP